MPCNTMQCNTTQYQQCWMSNSATMVWTPHKPISETKNVPKNIGLWKFRGRAQITLCGPPGTQKGPDTRSKCVVTMSPTQTGQSGAVGGRRAGWPKRASRAGWIKIVCHHG